MASKKAAKKLKKGKTMKRKTLTKAYPIYD